MWPKILCAVLIEADIFNKAVQENIPKPLRNLYINFDVNTLRNCGEMACVEEHLHTFGNSDITICSQTLSMVHARDETNYILTGSSFLINIDEKYYLFFVQDPGMHAFNFTAKKKLH